MSKLRIIDLTPGDLFKHHGAVFRLLRNPVAIERVWRSVALHVGGRWGDDLSSQPGSMLFFRPDEKVTR